MFEPPLTGIGLRDWGSFDRAVREGYEHALQIIEKHGVPLTDVWSDGPAVAIPHRETASPELASLSPVVATSS
jgi:NTE family protein